MTNEDIALEISRLTERFIRDNFTLQPANKDIVNRIKELQNICTHSDGSTNFAANGCRCIYCGRDFGYHGD